MQKPKVKKNKRRRKKAKEEETEKEETVVCTRFACTCNRKYAQWCSLQTECNQQKYIILYYLRPNIFLTFGSLMVI